MENHKMQVFINYFKEIKPDATPMPWEHVLGYPNITYTSLKPTWGDTYNGFFSTLNELDKINPAIYGQIEQILVPLEKAATYNMLTAAFIGDKIDEIDAIVSYLATDLSHDYMPVIQQAVAISSYLAVFRSLLG